MRSRFAALVLALGIVVAAHSIAGQNRPVSPAGQRPEVWRPDVSVLQTAPSLPAPTISEPFAIGEALHDPNRVGDAVVSLLALMGIPIVPNNPQGRLTIGTKLRLSESEVRALIDMGVTDADVQAQDSGGPFTFADLHKRLESSLPGISVERLAEIYATEYEQHPQSLVPQVLLGQPIEPDMPLLRTELWLLLVDGLLAPDAPRAAAVVRPREPRFVLARAVAVQDTSIAGLLQRVFQPPEFRRWQNAIRAQLEARLPLILASSITLTPGARAHEGHGGPGQTVTLEARFQAPPIEIEGTLPDAVLVPRESTLAGTTITWSTDGTIRRHAPNAPESRTQTVGANGAARLPLTPRAEAAKGRGKPMSAPGLVTLTVDDPEDLIHQTYGVSIYGLGPVTVNATAVMEWHAADTLEIEITNLYSVGSSVVGLTRNGVDQAVGTLALDPDGTYRGVVVLTSKTHRITLPGKRCGPDESGAWQFANVVAVPIAESETAGQRTGAFYTSVRTRRGYTFNSGQASRYFRLEFVPTTPPQYESRNPCLDEIPSDPTQKEPFRATPNFIPLNDAQWTIAGYGSAGARDTASVAGYAVAAPRATTADQPAKLDYEEARTPENQELLSGAGLGALMKAESKWYVTITHTKTN